MMRANCLPQSMPSTTIVKIFDGKTWTIKGLIRNDPYWDNLIREFRSQKAYYSHGSCCYNEKFKNGIFIEGADGHGGFFIDDASPNGRTPQLQMYWRAKLFVENPNEPGYVQIAPKKLSNKIRSYIGESRKMSQSIIGNFRHCVGVEEKIFNSACRYSYEISDSKQYSTDDSTHYVQARTFMVFLNPKTKLNTSNAWETVIDSVGIIAKVPSLAIRQFDSLHQSKRIERNDPKSIGKRDNVALVAWAISRYECVIINKRTKAIQQHVIRTIAADKCGDMCDSYSQYIDLNEKFRIHEHGYVR